MGHRICVSIASLAILVTTSCAEREQTSTSELRSSSAPTATRLTPVPTQSHAPVPPYRAANAEITAVATEFVKDIAEYDSRQEARLDFIGRLRGVASREALHELARSPRARLPWRVLRARGERAGLTVNGVTVERADADGRRVTVEATVRTHTDFGVVSNFARYTVTLAPGEGRWLVVDVEGLEP